jgi:hypothetical protein
VASLGKRHRRQNDLHGRRRPTYVYQSALILPIGRSREAKNATSCRLTVRNRPVDNDLVSLCLNFRNVNPAWSRPPGRISRSIPCAETRLAYRRCSSEASPSAQSTWPRHRERRRAIDVLVHGDMDVYTGDHGPIRTPAGAALRESIPRNAKTSDSSPRTASGPAGSCGASACFAAHREDSPVRSLL